MALFPIIEMESVSQVEDKVRINARKSFAAKGTDDITVVEIDPDGMTGFIDVTGAGQDDWYLDWVYLTSGDKTVTLRLTNIAGTQSTTFTHSVLTASEDNLFSTDDDLVKLETDILKWLPEGRSNYNYAHRAAQTIILDEMNNRLIVNSDGSRFTKDQLVDIREVQDWSKFKTLQLIFMNISNQPEDVFMQKAKSYAKKADEASRKAAIRFDRDSDGTIDDDEKFDLKTASLFRR
jgi:hypothetical protein